jgi:formate dehydrogenase maturation protein FdhE
MWNVVRGMPAVRLHRRHPDTVKAENCRSHVKILYQVNDHRLDAFADDDAHPLA